MVITINGIEYTTSVSDDTTTISWDTGSLSSGRSERELLKNVIQTNIRKDRELIFKETSWRFQTNYPYDDQDQWTTYLQEWRDLPSTYIHGQDIVLPTKPGE